MQHRPLEIYALAEHFPDAFVAPDLESCEGKLRRAEHHLGELRNDLAQFEGHEHSVTASNDADARQYIFTVHGIGEPKAEWSYIAGDCLHNIRAALDHLVFELAVLGQGGRRLEATETRSTEFPIYSDPKVFDGRGRTAIRLLRTGEQTRIGELQPFHAMDMSIWGPDPTVMSPSRTHPAAIPTLLAVLADLDNMDKHRRVHAAWGSARWYSDREPPEGFTGSSWTTARLHNGAEIGRWTYPEGAPAPGLPDDLERYFPICVALGGHTVFGEPNAGAYGAVDLLSWCLDAARRIVDLFRPCFVAGHPPLPVNDLEGDLPIAMFGSKPQT